MRTISRSLLAVLFAAVPFSAAAQNLLTNPGFDGNANGWAGGADAYDSTRDAGGNAPASGSWLGTYTGSNASVPAIDQCVPITALQTYGFGAKIFIASGQGQTGYGSPQINFYSDAGCGTYMSGSSVDAPQVTTSTTDAWVLSNASATAPAGAVSALLRLWIAVTSTGTIQVSYDDAFLGVGLVPVSLTSFSAD